MAWQGMRMARSTEQCSMVMFDVYQILGLLVLELSQKSMLNISQYTVS